MILSGRGGAGGGGGGAGCSRFPFTASQWQELEHQALIFKYIVSGVPIPPDLLFTIRRSSLLDSKQQQLFAHPPPPGPAPLHNFGWNCFQMGGLGMRKIDPEPGRCRRTDGKKWRCSKEAFQDSKYCEKHMHRGKNRSRKPVEQSLIINNNKHVPTPSYSRHSSLSSSVTSDNHHYPAYNNPYRSKVDSSHLVLDSASYYNNRTKYNNSHNGLKEDVDEQCFFNKASATTVKGFATGLSMEESSWQLNPLRMSSTQSGRQQMTEDDRREHHQPQQQKTAYRFLEEWPPEKSKTAAASWLNLDDHSSSSSSTTQLSISIPAATSHHFFPISRNQNDG